MMIAQPLMHYIRSLLPFIDKGFVFIVTVLVSVGLIMMTSASLDYSLHKYNSELFHFYRQFVFIVIGCVAGVIAFHVPMEKWYSLGWLALLVGFGFLIAVLIPGVGREVNGSMRWIPIGPINLQSSELAKVCALIYMAGYLVRRQDEVRETWFGFIKPILVMCVLIMLLLLEPDFGSAVVLIISCMGMIFLGGVGMKQFLTTVVFALAALVLMAVSSAYRMKRLQCFVDPWQYQFDCGYQLTQALIAFGRGEISGLGLGNSIQKLFYLPEAHTDFVFSILAEELGFIGGITVLLLFAVLIVKIFRIAYEAQKQAQLFSAYLCYGIALVIASQVFINIGVNTGLLPTKGLTLPFFSYGGSSMIMALVMMAIVLRTALESNMLKAGVKAPQASGLMSLLNQPPNKSKGKSSMDDALVKGAIA